MYRTHRLKVKPTKKEEELFFKSANIARFTYNWALDRWNKQYAETKKPVSAFKLITEFNQFKKEPGNEWLLEVSQKVASRAIQDLEHAFEMFFKGASKYPRFHSYRQTKPSFFVRFDGPMFKGNKIRFEKIGYVRYSGEIDTTLKYYNVRCKYDGVNWYITLNYEAEPKKIKASEENVIGIDVGISTLAVLSNGKEYSNINKTKEVRRLEKKLVRLSRSQNRKYKMNNKPNEFKKTSNIVKIEKEIAKIFVKLRNIRVNYIRHVVKDIMDQEPTKVVMENLAIKNLTKNKHLRRSIESALWGEFMKQVSDKCEEMGVEFVKAERTFPSSKMCSTCGEVKKELALTERTYNCGKCGTSIDRDLNAAINLQHYTEA